MRSKNFEELKKIIAQDLLDEKIHVKIEKMASLYINDFMIGEAKELYFLLDSLVGRNEILGKYPNLSESYKNILDRLSWLALPFMTHKKVEENFKYNLILGVDLLEEGLIDRVKSFFDLAFGDIDLLETRRRLILNSIAGNKEKIGTKDLSVDGEEKVKPMIGGWIKDYNQSSDFEKRGQKLSIVEYFNKSKNASQLSKNQVKILRTVFEVYDFLRFLPGTTAIQETGHTLPENIDISFENSLERPEVVVERDISPSIEKPSQRENEIISAYKGDPRQQKAILSEEKKIDKKFGSSIAGLRAEFYKSVQSQNVNRTIALLRLLAQRDDLADFMKEDKKLSKFLSAVWEKQYGRELADEFKADPSDIRFIRLFLQYILQQRLGLPSSDAARFGLQIGNIFVNLGKKEYNKMAYFDVKTKSFRWFE